MNKIDRHCLKHSFTTHSVPIDVMAGLVDCASAPRAGDFVLAEVLKIGHHRRMEGRLGSMMEIFPGDRVITAFGNRYATDQFEAYVPAEPVAECDLVSVGGVCGQVKSRHRGMDEPTRLRILGAVCNPEGQPLNMRSFGLPHSPCPGHAEIILVVGASMNSGKTTTVGTLARALVKGGFNVAAAKVTGTAAGKDGRYFTSCGAQRVLDFTHAGHPSTFLLDLDELMTVYRTLVDELHAIKCDYILVEVADGILQRETKMMLDLPEFRASVDHLFFAANDSMSAECGARMLQGLGLPLRAISGAMTQSPLAIREAEAATGLPVFNMDQLMAGAALAAMNAPLPPVREPAVLSQPSRNGIATFPTFAGDRPATSTEVNGNGKIHLAEFAAAGG